MIFLPNIGNNTLNDIKILTVLAIFEPLLRSKTFKVQNVIQVTKFRDAKT